MLGSVNVQTLTVEKLLFEVFLNAWLDVVSWEQSGHSIHDAFPPRKKKGLMRSDEVECCDDCEWFDFESSMWVITTVILEFIKLNLPFVWLKAIAANCLGHDQWWRHWSPIFLRQTPRHPPPPPSPTPATHLALFPLVIIYKISRQFVPI